MARLSTETIIIAVMSVVILVVAIAILITFWNPLTEWIRGEQLPEQTIQETKSNLDSFVSNVEKCKLAKGTNCVCEGFTNWPGSFPKDSKLFFTSKGKDMEINWSFRNKVLSSAKLYNTRITGVLIEKQSINFDKVRNDIDIYNSKWIDFAKTPPIFDREGLNYVLGMGLGEPKVIDSRIFKDDKGIIYLLLSYNKAEEVEGQLKQLQKCS